VSALPTAGGVAGYFRNGTVRHEPDQRDQGGGLTRSQPAEATGGGGGDEGDDATEGDPDGERAGEQSPGALGAAGHDGALVLLVVAVGVAVAVLGLGGRGRLGRGGGLLEGDGALDVGFADLVGDEEGGEAGDQADQEATDQKSACGHQGSVRQTGVASVLREVSCSRGLPGRRGGAAQWQG
jgi:hypothetical protein